MYLTYQITFHHSRRSAVFSVINIFQILTLQAAGPRYEAIARSNQGPSFSTHQTA